MCVSAHRPGTARRCGGVAGARAAPARAHLQPHADADPRRADLRGGAAGAADRRQRPRPRRQSGSAALPPAGDRGQPQARGRRRGDPAIGGADLPGARRAAAGDRAGRVAVPFAGSGADRRAAGANRCGIGEHALRDLPDRQQSLQAAIRWSYDLLTPAARQALRHASVFRGGLPLAAALEAVTDSPVRAEINELRAGGEDDAARARHRRYFAALVAPADRGVRRRRARPASSPRPLLADHANVREAAEDAITAGDEEAAVTLALGSRPMWLAGMLRQEAHELAERLLDRFEIPGDREVALPARRRLSRLQPDGQDVEPAAGLRGGADRRSRGAGPGHRQPLRPGAQRPRPGCDARVAPAAAGAAHSRGQRALAGGGPTTSSRSTRTSAACSMKSCEHAVSEPGAR